MIVRSFSRARRRRRGAHRQAWDHRSRRRVRVPLRRWDPGHDLVEVPSGATANARTVAGAAGEGMAELTGPRDLDAHRSFVAGGGEHDPSGATVNARTLLGATATTCTLPMGPVSVRRSRPVRGYQMRTVPLPAAASQEPSGATANASLEVASVVPGRSGCW